MDTVDLRSQSDDEFEDEGTELDHQLAALREHVAELADNRCAAPHNSLVHLGDLLHTLTRLLLCSSQG